MRPAGKAGWTLCDLFAVAAGSIKVCPLFENREVEQLPKRRPLEVHILELTYQHRPISRDDLVHLLREIKPGAPVKMARYEITRLVRLGHLKEQDDGLLILARTACACGRTYLTEAKLAEHQASCKVLKRLTESKLGD